MFEQDLVPCPQQVVLYPCLKAFHPLVPPLLTRGGPPVCCLLQTPDAPPGGSASKNLGLPLPLPITNDAGCTSSYTRALPTSPDIPHPVIKCTSSLATPCHSSWNSLNSFWRAERPVPSSGSSLDFPHFIHSASALWPMRSSATWCFVPALRPGPGILSSDAFWHGVTALMSSSHCHFTHHSTGLCVAKPVCTVLPCHSHGARARSTMP